MYPQTQLWDATCSCSHGCDLIKAEHFPTGLQKEKEQEGLLPSASWRKPEAAEEKPGSLSLSGRFQNQKTKKRPQESLSPRNRRSFF